jgi:gluconolactonase
MVVEARSAKLDSLIDHTAELTCLGDGFLFTEGPVWSAVEECLYFSDIPNDARWRWSEKQGMELVMKPAYKCNGLVFDRDGSLIVCEQLSSAVTRYKRDGTSELIAYHYQGKYLNSPNDIVVRSSDGSIYFTDPDYGRWNDVIGAKRSRELDFKGVFRAPAHGGAGEAQLLVATDEFDQPNGLCFSPDETLLYVDDSPRGHIKALDVRPDGSLDNARVFFAGIGPGIEPGDEATLEARHSRLHNAGAVDGMKCDEQGNIWISGPGGLWIISSQGEHLGVLRTPEVVGNLAWGGADLRSLFIMTSTTVHVVKTLVGPAPLPHL